MSFALKELSRLLATDTPVVGAVVGIGGAVVRVATERGAVTARTLDTGAIDALRESVAAQGQRSGVRWADALSISVRPVITYWFMALYCAAKTAAFAAAVTAGAGWGTAILHAWTEADQALWAGVLNFWFLGRVFDRVRP